MALTTHLTDDELTDLLEENLPPRGQEGGLIHLSACRSCHERLQELFPEVAPARFRKWFGTSEPPESFVPSALDLEVALRWGDEKVQGAVREMEEARELWSEIAALEPAQQRIQVLSEERFTNRGFPTVLLGAAERIWRDVPHRALNLCDLAASIVDRLTPSDAHDEDLLHDLRAHTYAYRATCHRILGALDSAHQDLVRSCAHLDQGTGDPMERVEVMSRLGSYYRARRHFRPALQSVRTARRIYREMADVHGEVTVSIQEALTFLDAQQPGRCLKILQELEEQFLPQDTGNVLQYAIHHNTVNAWISLGCPQEARRAQISAKRLAIEVGNNRFDLLRLSWLDGKLQAIMGDHDQAAATLYHLQQCFLREGIGLEAALVSLDLALFYGATGRSELARNLSAELVPVFLANRFHREAMASWLLFWKASGR